MTTAAHIEALLKERIGLDAGTVGPGMIERAVRERLAAAAAPDHHAYWNLLHVQPDELQALIEAVVVPETWFFRHREALLALARIAAMRVFGSAREHEDAGPLRILSVPCSTGEEPYSIVMALLDAGVPEQRFQVDAVDISARSLERARIGQYGSNSFRGSPLDFRDRHFTASAGGYTLKASVRAKVRLLRGNLLDPVLMANEAPYHFVFCRNLLIYFDQPTQRRSLKVLERLSRPDATIFVGPAEASLLTRHGFVSAGVPLAFAFTRRSAHAQAPGNPAVPDYLAQLSDPVRAAPPPLSWPARTAVPARPLAPRGQARPMAIPPLRRTGAGHRQSGCPGQCRRRCAGQDLPACRSRRPRRRGGGLPGAPGSAGPVGRRLLPAGRAPRRHRPAGRRTREAYRRALYLDPAHQEALYHMAAILEAEGDGAAAARLRHRAQRKTPTHHG
ncbi:CheR family methyltransferase [Cupriavidus basilensis]